MKGRRFEGGSEVDDAGEDGDEDAGGGEERIQMVEGRWPPLYTFFSLSFSIHDDS